METKYNEITFFSLLSWLLYKLLVFNKILAILCNLLGIRVIQYNIPTYLLTIEY